MNSLQKIVTPRDSSYIDWLHTLPCLLCGKQGVHAHHTKSGGAGIKGSDYSCIPVCPKCHTDIHQHHGKGNFIETEKLEEAIERLQEIYNTQIKGA